METIKITRALLDSYRKLLREINLLEKELEDMLQGDHGIGSSVVMDYRKGYPQPQELLVLMENCMTGEERFLRASARNAKQLKIGLMQLRIRQHAAFSKCTTLMD